MEGKFFYSNRLHQISELELEVFEQLVISFVVDFHFFRSLRISSWFNSHQLKICPNFTPPPITNLILVLIVFL